jgi:hypothetical protein
VKGGRRGETTKDTNLLFDDFDLLQGVRVVCEVRGYFSLFVWAEEEERDHERHEQTRTCCSIALIGEPGSYPGPLGWRESLYLILLPSCAFVVIFLRSCGRKKKRKTTKDTNLWFDSFDLFVGSIPRSLGGGEKPRTETIGFFEAGAEVWSRRLLSGYSMIAKINWSLCIA